MSKQVLRALPDLVQADIITQETAENIKAYYERQPGQSTNRLFIIFGILGAMLVGMGIVLILAHNWDILSKPAKLTIGFIPLIAGQAIAGYLLFKRVDNRAWKEGTGAFLFFAVAISIAIVSQVYNIEGSLSEFLLTWMCLSLPIVYVLRSTIASLLLIVGITWYACEAGYFVYHANNAPLYWLLLLLLLPFYYLEFLQKGVKNNFYYFHSWLLAISVSISLGVFANSAEQIIMIAYMSLFSGFVIMGEMKLFATNSVLTNAYLVTGSLGVISLLLFLTFENYWESVPGLSREAIILTPEFGVAAMVTLINSALLFIQLRGKRIVDINSKSFAFILFIILFVVAINAPQLSQILTNLVILFLAVHTIRSGAQQNHLGILNYGLLIITALIICRFFDTNFSFIIRGILFIVVGIGFFAANYQLIKKRRIR